MDDIARQAEEGKGEHYEPEVEDLRAKLVLFGNRILWECFMHLHSTQLNSKSPTYLIMQSLYSEITGSRFITNMPIMHACAEITNLILCFFNH